MDSKKSHRDRKNGASREQWEKQKQDRNKARGPQSIINGPNSLTHRRVS